MRYERQEVLKHIGKKGQAKLEDSSVVIVGVGSTGTVTAELLARVGVGKITLIDHDVIEETNLNRQLLYSEEDIGKPKAIVATEKLRKINSRIEIKAEQEHLAYNNVEILKADLILDCTDNIQTRLLINDYSKKKDIPWIYAAAVEDRGMIYVTMKGRPCFNCLFEKAKDFEDCETIGILNSASTMVSSIQATEALKILLGEEPVEGLLMINVWKNVYKNFRVKKNEGCNACNGIYENLEAKKDYRIEYCKTKAAMSAKPQKNFKLNMDKLKKEFEVKADAGIVLVVMVEDVEAVIHDYGEILFKEEEDEEKLAKLTNKIYEAGS